MPDKVCFVISSIGEVNSDIRKLADEKYDLVFKPVLEKLNYEIIRADKENSPSSISREIISRLIHSDLVIADVSDSNPNVFYELAIRNAVKKPVIVIKTVGQKLPFDIYDKRAIPVNMLDNRQWNDAKTDLEKYVIAAENDPTKASESIVTDLTFKMESEEKSDPMKELLILMKDMQDELRKMSSISGTGTFQVEVLPPENPFTLNAQINYQGFESGDPVLIELTNERGELLDSRKHSLEKANGTIDYKVMTGNVKGLCSLRIKSLRNQIVHSTTFDRSSGTRQNHEPLT